MCQGVTATHKHEKWGIAGPSQQFATSMETAYPMPSARAIASAFILALHKRGIRMPLKTMADIQDIDSAMLPAMRAQTGLQSKASKLPPLIPLFAAKLAITGFQSDLPQHELPTEACRTTESAIIQRAHFVAKGLQAPADLSFHAA